MCLFPLACPPGFDPAHAGCPTGQCSECYKAITTQLTVWADAVAACEGSYTGARLVEISNEDEDNNIQIHIMKYVYHQRSMTNQR